VCAESPTVPQIKPTTYRAERPLAFRADRFQTVHTHETRIDEWSLNPPSASLPPLGAHLTPPVACDCSPEVPDNEQGTNDLE